MSFSEYYKKWKEDNNVTEEIEYNPNLTQAERNEFIEQSMNRRIEELSNRMEQARNNRGQSSTQNQERSIWDRVQDISNFNNNSKLMLNNNQNTNYRQSILNAGNRNKILEQETKKSNNLLETLNNKDKTMLFSEKEKQVVPIKENNEEKDKNENILEDAGSLATLVGLGVSTGGKEVFNYIESANENNFDGYKDLKKKQFLTSQKVSEEDKAKAKIQDNLLLSSNGIKTADENRVETNLVKKAIRDSINKDNEKIQEEQNKISNQGMQTLGKIAPSMGQMLPGMALNAVNPILGTTYFTTSAGGGYIDDALNRGMNEQQAFKYGTVMGALEGASESIITGQQLSKVKKAFTGKEISKKLLNSYGFNIFENAVQEAVMEPAQEITAGIVGDKADWSNMGSRMLESGFNGALMGAISNGVTFGLEKSGNVYDKIKNGENITETEYKEALQENINKFGKNAVENAIKKGATEVYQEINNIQQQSTQNENIGQNIANNQQSLYNNSNESESDINGYKRDTVERGNRVYEEQKQQQNREYTWEEYNKWEQSIKPIETNQLNNNEQESINKAKSEYNKDVVLYDANNNDNTYSGGASQQTKNKITISRQSAKEFGLNKMIDHENVESDILHNDSARDILSPVINVIMQDKKFNSQKENFWKGQNGNIPTDYLIAKDIICDRFSEIQQGEKLDYENVLSNATNSTIDNALSNYYKQVYGKELDIPSSFNLSENKKNPSRHEVIQQNRKLARENIKNIANWKDKKRGLSYQLETMERNMYDIIPDKEEAQKINDTYFNPIHESEAQKQKFINSYNDRIKEFNLNKYESEAVQYLGEKKYNPDFNKGDQETIAQRKIVDDRIQKNINEGKIDEQKVNEAIETFRSIYDELFEIENKTLRENGYKEKPYRKGYFPHFVDYVPETKTEKVLNKLGFKIDKRPLPTDIAGITEQFVPGKTWNKSALERKGNKTDYNALKGFDTYISQASDNIFHTENIQRLRGLENEIRYQYSDKGIQERIDKIVNDETLFEDEKQQLLDQILEQTNNPMPNLVTELRRYTNALANKKSEADRSIENMMGRSVYSTVNAIENRFGANAVGLNIGSAVTNFIPITQAWSQVSTKNMGRAVIDTVKSYINNDGFTDRSTFLTSRINQAEKLYKTSIEKVSDKTSFLFNAIDEVTSNIVVRSKYLDNIQKGMSENEAIKNADQFARNVIADRSKGALPTKFEEKNPITKAFTQFQLEVNNQYRYMFKDLPRDLKEKGLGAIALAFFKMFVGAWLYNEASEKITGRRPAFDPIDIATSAYKDITDEKKGTYDKITSIGKNVAEEIPFVGGLVGGGRIPVNGAIPDVGNITKAGVGLATGEMDSNKAISNIGKEVAKPLYYLLPPFGGAQIKKSVEGISTVANGGSYGIDSKGRETLQFPVENANIVDGIKAGVFGKYALPLAKDYTENNYKSLNANQTKAYKESKIPYKEYLEYLNQDLKKNEDKINYINKQNWGESQKWGLYVNEILSDNDRKDGSSQVEDAKYIVKNGVSKKEYMNLYNEASNRNIKLPNKDEFSKLKEEGISFSNYVDYQIQVHDKTDEYKKNGQLDENKQLKNKDKIEILLNAKYSDSEKEAIYKKSINSQDKKVQIIDELGIPLRQYLKYRQQDFSNDKNIEGETISKTGKQKLYNYLNNIPDASLPEKFKKIICKMEGVNDYDSEVSRIVLNNNKLTAQRQKEILKILGFKVDKNGNISSNIMLPINKVVK